MNLTCCFIAVGVVNHINILSNIYLVVLTDKHLHIGVFTLCTCWLTILVYANCHGAAAFVFFNQTLQKSFMATFGGENLYFLRHSILYITYISQYIYTETFYIDLFYSS